MKTQKDICTSMFTGALLTIAKIWKQHDCPSMNGQINSFWYINTMEYYSVINKKAILSFATWWDLKDIMLSEINHTEKVKHHKTSLLCGIPKKKNNNNKLTDTEDRLVIVRGRGRGRGRGREWAKWLRVAKGTTFNYKINESWGFNERTAWWLVNVTVL